METAKVFGSGRSQAIRLPRAFRVDGREVRDPSAWTGDCAGTGT